MNLSPENQILDENGIHRAIVRVTHEILERNGGSNRLMMVGIRTRGVSLAKRICSEIEKIEGEKVSLGILDITLYRDDLGEIGPKPDVKETDLQDDINGKTIVLVDDVLFTGRTIRAALDALVDYGRPKSIQLAVLIDRGHRELPIKADYVGKNIPTSRDQEVILRLTENDSKDEAVLTQKADSHE